jgi:hypothetical protein
MPRQTQYYYTVQVIPYFIYRYTYNRIYKYYNVYQWLRSINISNVCTSSGQRCCMNLFLFVVMLFIMHFHNHFPFAALRTTCKIQLLCYIHSDILHPYYSRSTIIINNNIHYWSRTIRRVVCQIWLERSWTLLNTLS